MKKLPNLKTILKQINHITDIRYLQSTQFSFRNTNVNYCYNKTIIDIDVFS